MIEAAKGPVKQQNHHPRWQNNYDQVEVWLSTSEDDGAITFKDVVLALSLEDLWLKEKEEHLSK